MTTEPHSRLGRLRRAQQRWRRLGRVARLLVATQLAFNIGFYAVLPFLADHLADDLALSGAVVGLVLGLRTFSQQGLFALGGALADRYGARPLIVTGCLVRCAGFLVLGVGESVPTVLIGAMLTGFAGALFSPAVESALAVQARRPEDVGGMDRTEVFALFAVSGNVGAVAGPLLGTALVSVGFRISCLVAAVLFAVIAAVHRMVLPARPGEHAADALGDGWRAALSHRRFMAFACGYAGYLVAYNQLYLAIPDALEDATGSTRLLGPLFVLSSVMVIAAQLRVTATARRFAPRRVVATGFALMACGFAAVLVTVSAASGRSATVAALVACVVLLTAGQMTVVPVAQSLVPVLASDRHLGAHFGVLASCGGLAVVVVNPLVGRLLDLGQRPVAAWTLLAALPLLAAVVVGRAISGAITLGGR